MLQQTRGEESSQRGEDRGLHLPACEDHGAAIASVTLKISLILTT